MSEADKQLIDIAVQLALADGLEMAGDLIVAKGYDNAKIISEYIYAKARELRRGKSAAIASANTEAQKASGL